MNKILITGGNGQLAQAIKEVANEKIISLSRLQLDITQSDMLINACRIYQPRVIINTAAYTAVDLAEDERDHAQHINEIGARTVAQVAHQFRIPLIHVSTDYVFSGRNTMPYHELDVCDPINYYGLTKWRGELAVQECASEYLILRVSGVFSPYGKNFLKTMLRLLQEKRELSIVADQEICPTSALDIAQCLLALVQQPWKSGIYHYCSMNPTTWYDFTQAISKALRTLKPDVNPILLPIASADYPTKATRPAYSVLNCDKIKNIYGISAPSWEQAVENIVPGLLKD